MSARSWKYPKYDYGLPEVGEWVEVSVAIDERAIMTIAAVNGFFETKHLTYEGEYEIRHPRWVLKNQSPVPGRVYAWRELPEPAPEVAEEK